MVLVSIVELFIGINILYLVIFRQCVEKVWLLVRIFVGLEGQLDIIIVLFRIIVFSIVFGKFLLVEVEMQYFVCEIIVQGLLVQFSSIILLCVFIVEIYLYRFFCNLLVFSMINGVGFEDVRNVFINSFVFLFLVSLLMDIINLLGKLNFGEF